MKTQYIPIIMILVHENTHYFKWSTKAMATSALIVYRPSLAIINSSKSLWPILINFIERSRWTECMQRQLIESNECRKTFLCIVRCFTTGQYGVRLLNVHVHLATARCTAIVANQRNANNTINSLFILEFKIRHQFSQVAFSPGLDKSLQTMST